VLVSAKAKAAQLVTAGAELARMQLTAAWVEPARTHLALRLSKLVVAGAELAHAQLATTSLPWSSPPERQAPRH
jgi:hypothetical protein